MLALDRNPLNVFDGNIRFSANKDSGTGGHASRSTTSIDSSFFNRPAADVAKDLIGRIIESRIGNKEVSGIIVETAAYTGEADPQSHEYKIKKGQHVEWQPGSLYIYSTQGHTMLTVTTAPFKDGATVLIRALEPLNGIDEMISRFGEGGTKDIFDSITKGPGKLSKALGITSDLNGYNILGQNAEIGILPGFQLSDEQIMSSRRKGEKSGVTENLRFFRRGSDWIS